MQIDGSGQVVVALVQQRMAFLQAVASGVRQVALQLRTAGPQAASSSLLKQAFEFPQMKRHVSELQVVPLHSAFVQSNVHERPPLHDLPVHWTTQS